MLVDRDWNMVPSAEVAARPASAHKLRPGSGPPSRMPRSRAAPRVMPARLSAVRALALDERSARAVPPNDSSLGVGSACAGAPVAARAKASAGRWRMSVVLVEQVGGEETGQHDRVAARGGGR